MCEPFGKGVLIVASLNREVQGTKTAAKRVSSLPRQEASEALGVPADRVFKTLIADVDGQLTVAVVPVSGSLDTKALATATGGKKAAMAEPAQAERASGYVTGGIAPLGLRRPLPVVIDETALGYPTIFCSAGQRGMQIELAPADLVAATGAQTAPIARPEARR